MPQFSMVIDLKNCIGCGSCVEACHQFNEVPPGSIWRRVFEKTEIDKGNLIRFFLSMSCMHCDDPPCVKVCPTKATNKSKFGIIDINEDLCIGCASCVLACPYNARSINNSVYLKNFVFLTNRTDACKKLGVASKCNFCKNIVENGLKRGLIPGNDLDATPMCVRSCIGGALSFGDLEDQNSYVSQVLNKNNSFSIMSELGTSPNVFYLPVL
jgi:phenylacetyl-CoA:acceptor oxidoreductase 27-kDa subunit